ncbi:YvcK family protein [Candidatus Pacebacteria bacterium]|nr:YvcK family protein [Candidatus Paceibacterota bacterium]
MKPKSERKNIVVIGGGTGTYTLLHGLKSYWGDINITKIVSMADSGGATGRLRDEFGQLPVGDARMGLAALAADVDEHEQLLRELLLYRFDRGNGLSGHNFGNLLLVALTDMLGSETEAIKAASRLLRVRGKVLPVTEDNVHLVATYDDGTVVVGEHDIDEPPRERENSRITKLETDKPARITKDADAAIRAADMIIIGPGDLYTSLLANCVIAGVSDAIESSTAQFVYVTNLMTRPGQTRGMKISNYLSELESYVGRKPDTVLINTTPLPIDIIEKYAQEGDCPVEDDLVNGIEIVRGDFLIKELVEKKEGDVLKRALIRHDGKKLANAIIGLL